MCTVSVTMSSAPPERFLVAEVHDGQITHLRGYATEPEAHERCTPARRRTPHRTPISGRPRRTARDERVEMSQPIVSLRPLTRTDLAAITPWFEDPDTRCFLGGPDWPAAMLDHGERAVGETFRGGSRPPLTTTSPRRRGRAIGYIDCGDV